MPFSFQNQNITFQLKNKLPIKAWMKRVIELEKKKPGQVNFVFTSDEALLKINVQFLNHATYTDIITFDSGEGDLINGDILISVERVKENANKFKVPFNTELERIMIHGVLHLCGYKDKSKSDKALMRKKEEWAMKLGPYSD